MGEKDRILERIARKSGVEDLVSILSDKLSGSDLKSLMLEVYSRRSQRASSAEVLSRFASDPLSHPSRTDPVALNEAERLAFDLARKDFDPIELSPICPLGTISSLTRLHQDRVVSTIRNTEVVSDSTNVMALECASRRRRGEPAVRLCSSHRLVRPSADLKPGDLAHFRLFGLCSSFRRGNGIEAELGELLRHLRFHVSLLSRFDGKVRVTVSDFGAKWTDEVGEAVAANLPQVRVEVDRERGHGRGYYTSICLHVYLEVDGNEYFIADGGLVDWGARLLGDKRERMLISGLGTERLAGLTG
ncbi:MAG TPA: hypothetical protein VG944_00640 [Fimbriimonas sp.]|nr:hypothetical protein [Fimbriimonas sp.]